VRFSAVGSGDVLIFLIFWLAYIVFIPQKAAALHLSLLSLTAN
jgi:hypothetical protein